MLLNTLQCMGPSPTPNMSVVSQPRNPALERTPKLLPEYRRPASYGKYTQEDEYKSWENPHIFHLDSFIQPIIYSTHFC